MSSTQAIGPVPADAASAADPVDISSDPAEDDSRLELVSVPTETDSSLDGAAAEPAVVSAPRSSHPKKSVEFAWAAWQATTAAAATTGAAATPSSTASSGSEFLQSVSSWTEGTAAQLLRRRWTVGFKPPTSTQIQERLRHNLALAARGRPSTHMEALGRARDSVIEELRRAQLPARASAPKPSAPA